MTPRRQDEDFSVDQLRAEMVRGVLGLTAVGAPLGGALALTWAGQAGELTAVSVGFSSVSLVFPVLWLVSGSWTPERTARVLLAILTVAQTLVLLRGGITAPAAALQLCIVALSGLLFGRRGVVLGLAGVLAGFALAGFAVVGGYGPARITAPWDPTLAPAWIRGGLLLGIFGVAVGSAVVYIVGRLDGALERERARRVELLRSEAERAHAREAVVEAQRVEALGRLAAGVAHDFNNALTVVMASTELARLSLDRPDELRRCLDDIDRATEQASDLTRNLLLLGRREVSQPVQVDLGTFLPGLVRVWRRVLPDDVELRLEDPRGGVYVDPAQLERVLLNVVIHARDAARPDASLRIEVGCRLEERGLDGDGLAKGPYVALWVRDNGRGMDADTRAQIFDPFFTASRPGKGTGMGMALVQGFAEAAAGQAQIESAPGEGTTVTVHLPRVEPTSLARSGRRSSHTPPAPSPESRRLLVVEDHPEVRSTLSRLLEGAGFQVVTVQNGNEAIALVGDLDQRFDLLVLDGVIPGASSAAVMKHVRQERPALPVVVCSGYVEEELLRSGIQTGRLACVRKPFTSEQLLECIATQLGA